ncbi:MAG: O-antigen ligase family protein [Akkermansiaceae bacterium]|nr:O-antigen ligase family protein [Armatimonadota bacterium]
MVSPVPLAPDRHPKMIRAATPWWVVLVGVLAAIGVGTLSAVNAKAVLALWIVLIAVTLVARSWKNPWLALTVCIALYPIITIARPIYNVYGLPVFNSGVRCFPELIQCLILSFLLVRHSLQRTEQTRLKIVGDDLPVVAYLLVAIYSVVIGCMNAHPLAPLNGWFVSVTPAVFYLIIRWLKPTDAQKNHLIRAVLAVYCVIAIPSIVDYFVRSDVGILLANSERPYFVPSPMDWHVYWRIYPRMQSLLWEENFFGELSNIVILLIVSYLLYQRGRLTLYLTLMLAVLSLILTISRGAYMSLAIGLCVLLLHRSPNRRAVICSIVVLIVCGAILLSTTIGAPVLFKMTDRLDTLTMANAESGELTSDRVHHWTRAWRSFLYYPSGTGLGTAGFAAHLSRVAEHTVGEGIFFRILAEQGILGLLVFVYLLASIFWILLTYLPVCHIRDRPLGAAMLAFHTGFVVHSTIASTYDYYFVVPVYWILIGLFVSRTHQYLDSQRGIRRIGSLDAAR